MNITATNRSPALLLGVALISISFAAAFNGLGSYSSISLSPIRSQKLIIRLVDSPFDEISSQIPTTRLYMSKSTEEGVPSTPLDRPVLAAIDTLAILVFAAIGKASHAPDGSIDFLSVGMTAFPFLLSWFVASPLLGCYKPDATSDIKSAVVQTGKGWLVAVPLGCRPQRDYQRLRSSSAICNRYIGRYSCNPEYWSRCLHSPERIVRRNVLEWDGV